MPKLACYCWSVDQMTLHKMWEWLRRMGKAPEAHKGAQLYGVLDVCRLCKLSFAILHGLFCATGRDWERINGLSFECARDRYKCPQWNHQANADLCKSTVMKCPQFLRWIERFSEERNGHRKRKLRYRLRVYIAQHPVSFL